MNRIKAILIDLSGTIHIENEVISGSINALKRLRETGKFKLRFVTNTTKESKNSLHRLLTNIGFEIDKNEIFSSLTAARRLVESKGLRPLLFLEQSALEDFEGIDTENPNAVVIGLAPNKFDYENLNEAFRLILNGAKLIGIHKSRYFKRKDGLTLGPGAFIAGLEYSTNCKAEIVGKPCKEFFLSSIEDFNVRPDECLMIGDDVNDDIQGALNAGMNGILVKTGKYRENDEFKLSQSPLLIVENFADAVDFILKEN